MLEKGDKIAIVGCSDPMKHYETINKLFFILESRNLVPVISPYLFGRNSTPANKAAFLCKCFKDKKIKAIFDITGGDLANEILGFIDFNVIKNNPKPFFGYSDNTCILAAINRKCKINTYLYQMTNIIYKNRESFFDFIFENNCSIFNFSYDFVQGSYMDGRMAGGNIRCLLKLAGTEFFPDLYGRILFLESKSGNENRIRAYFAQLRQMHIFNMVSGVVLGTFTELEKDSSAERVVRIAKENIPENIPIIKTNEIGHQSDSKILEIGKYYRIGRMEKENNNQKKG